MTPTDDDVIARLRASLKATADRTPIGAGRFANLDAVPAQSHGRAFVTVLSAAAAVATIACVAAVVGTHAARIVQPAAGGNPTLAASLVPSSSGQATTPGIAPVQSSGACVPENYYVTASPAEVAGLTYMLPATPAGYVLYGAWGTISRNLCADSVTWYVEYDPAAGTPGSGTDAYQLTVSKVGGDSVRGDFASRRPVPSTPITVNGADGYVFDKATSYPVIGWTTGGAAITLAGPGDLASLVKAADSVVLLNPGDPRIVAPANCQVPPGSVCGSDSATPTPTVSPSSTLTADPFVGPVPTPTPTAR